MHHAIIRSCWAFLVAASIVMTQALDTEALEVNSLSLNLVEHPTKNKNIFGTTFDALDFVDDWGSNYMMYRLNLTSDPEFLFENLYIQVFANRGNQNGGSGNPLRFALFGQNPVANNLNDSDALARTTINTAQISPTFTNYLMGPGPGNMWVYPQDNDFPEFNEYYLMIYAGGGVANQGFGLKIDPDAPQVEFYAPEDPFLDVKYWNGASFQTAVTFVPTGTPVPEPSVWATAGIAALTCGAIRLRRRRQARSAVVNA
jgi:hypothetical protein